MSMLELHSVSKRFHRGGETVIALDRVDATVESGESVALIGPSGSGKSTFLHLAGGLDTPEEGRVIVAGQDLQMMSARELAKARRRKIGFVFQFFQLLPALTVLENVELPLLLDGDRNPRPAATRLIEQVGLASRIDRLPGELSGGEMQRVAIARALVAKPVLILADEPTGNLDSATGSAILDLLSDQVAQSGASLVLATHDAMAAARADRTLVLKDGRLSDCAGD